MQRPQQNDPRQWNAQQNSPAYIMASRIRNEQGAQRAGEYLAAMEPFLAPGERAHIAASLGVPLIVREKAHPPQQTGGSQGGMDPMQLMGMLSALGGLGGIGGGNQASPLGGNKGGMGDPMMLAQLLGGLMGKK